MTKAEAAILAQAIQTRAAWEAAAIRLHPERFSGARCLVPSCNLLLTRHTGNVFLCSLHDEADDKTVS